MRTTTLLLVTLVGAASSTGAADSRAVYLARCARCHGETGKGDGKAARALKVSPLVDHHELAKMSPEQIVALVKADPKHRGVVDLDPADLAAAVVYVKELAKQSPADSSPR